MTMSLFFEMGWKSAVIAGVALLLATLLRSRSAADRAALLRVGVGLLLMLPVLNLALPALQVTALAPVEQVPPPAPMLEQSLVFGDSSLPADTDIAPAPSESPFPSAATLLLWLYVAGLGALLLRLAAGIATLRRWTRDAEPVVDRRWAAALDRAGSDGAPRLLMSDEVPAPMSWGLIRPVILIDRATLTRSQDADAVIAHEMAHVARGDWPALILARVSTALFWFNPLVWLLQNEVAQQAEEAADACALGAVEATHYAQTLVACARHSGKRVPANSIAQKNGLARRIRRVLDGEGHARPGSRWARIAMIGCAAIAAPVAAIELIPAAPKAPEAPAAPAAPVAAAATQAPAAPPAPPAQEFDMAIDEEAIEHAAAEAARSAELAAVDASRIAAEASGIADRVLAAIDVEKITADAMKAAQKAHVHAAAGMASGAEAMLKGADTMERHARDLRDPAYREREIAKQAARGETVTHQELLDAIPELIEGAREMREGAAEMKAAAEEMRREGF